MTVLSGKTALVTGASSGLGVDFAQQLAAMGTNIILVARRTEKLEAVKQDIEKKYAVRVDLFPQDLTAPNAVETLYLAIQSANLSVDVLINNAGFGLYGQFLDISWQNEKDMLTLDMFALTHLTKKFAKDMIQRGNGYILQVSSLAAYQPTPGYATYAAAKSYVLSFTEAFNYELKGTGVSCTALSPGVTATEFFDVSGQKPSLYQRFMIMKSEDVARIGLKAMLKRRGSVVPGFGNWLTAFLVRFVTRSTAAAFADRLMK